MILIVLLTLWTLLMLRSVMAEYKYYQSVKTHEPDIWRQLGAPTFIKVPIVFVSVNGLKALNRVSNTTVRANGEKHKRARLYFITYVMLVLLASVLYLKFI